MSSSQSRIPRRMETRARAKRQERVEQVERSLAMDIGPELLESLATTPLEMKVPTTDAEMNALPAVLMGNISHGLEGEWPEIPQSVRDLIAILTANTALQIIKRLPTLPTLSTNGPDKS